MRKRLIAYFAERACLSARRRFRLQTLLSPAPQTNQVQSASISSRRRNLLRERLSGACSSLLKRKAAVTEGIFQHLARIARTFYHNCPEDRDRGSKQMFSSPPLNPGTSNLDLAGSGEPGRRLRDLQARRFSCLSAVTFPGRARGGGPHNLSAFVK